MRRTLFALFIGALIPTAVYAAPLMNQTDGDKVQAGTKVIFDQTYAVSPGVPYQTGLVRLSDAPIFTDRIILKQSGANCRLVSSGVHYTTDSRSAVFNAESLDVNTAVYHIPAGRLESINLLFEQRLFDANCRITIEAEVDATDNDDDDDDTWVDYETVENFEIRADWGREPKRVGPFEVNDLVKAIRVFIPRDCGDVALLDGALEIDNEWQEIAGDAFNMSRTESEKTFTLDFRRITELQHAAFRIRGKRRDCTAEVQVVYY